jgi:glycosyltransferase involved in cell wall biosynthesis
VTTGPVVVDLQALQSPDYRGRGISRYAYELATSLERRYPELVCRYLLNPELPPPGDLGALLGSGKVAYGEVPESARLLHALSPFELGVPIDRVWPRWAHEHGVRFCATVYDLIPLENPRTYLGDASQRNNYMARLEVLRGADGLLTISAATSRSLEANLGIEARKLHMVGAGTGARFAPAEEPEQALSLALEAVPGLEDRFVLYPAGSDGRKNVEALVVAFARLPEALRTTHQLVVLGHLPASMANHFLHVATKEGVGGRVLCPGHVSDETMLHLYQSTELLCFPSLMEGYGLPVAEALACGAVAIVSDVDPLRDLVAPEARFDPHSPTAIATAIEVALTDEGFKTAARAHALAGITTWGDVADRTAAAYKGLLSRPGRAWKRRQRRRLAVVSPFPPIASGIANYSFRLVEELAAIGTLDIDCFADGLDRSKDEPVAPSGLQVYDARALFRVEGATAGYDQVLYVLGNGEFHTAALESLRRRSGVVLAHEVRLSGLYRFAAVSRAAVPAGLAGAIRKMYGPLLPEGLGSSGAVSAVEAERYGLLMSREAIGLADRFLVTSHAAARLARIEAGPELASRIGVVGFATGMPAAMGARASAVTGVEPGSRVIASFGIVDPIKQPHKLLHAFAALRKKDPDLVLALVGPISTKLESELENLATELGLKGRLFITGRVETEAYLGWLARAEIAVQLRATFSGEASAAVGDCLASGLAMVVSDIGWMGELPSDVASKVPVEASASELAQACWELLEDRPSLEALGMRARRYSEAHGFSDAARALLEELERAAAAESDRSGRNTA